MSEHEVRVAFGMAGFWTGIMLGLAVIGLPANALDLPSTCCEEGHSDQHVSGEQPVTMPLHWD